MELRLKALLVHESEYAKMLEEKSFLGKKP
jgi:hypothetical protein